MIVDLGQQVNHCSDHVDIAEYDALLTEEKLLLIIIIYLKEIFHPKMCRSMEIKLECVNIL